MPRHHVPPFRDLNLVRDYTNYTHSVVFETINAVPGLKTSAAFFTFLRANLVLLPSSTLSSTTSTPLLYPSSSQTLPPLRSSSLATMSSADDNADEVLPPNPLEGVPELTTKALTVQKDKVDALKLIADSVAQQRNLAARAIIFNPLIMALYIGMMAIMTQYLYKVRGDIGIVITTGAGLTMACLVAIRSATAGYVFHAEELTWDWTRNEDGDDDIIIGSRFGDEIIGAAVLRLERHGNGSVNGKKKKASGKTGGKGVVRAWTTKVRYRGKGVGTELLEEAVTITREKLGNSAEIGFAAEHANSKKVLPEFFNAPLRKREARAARALEKVVESMDGKKKK